VDAGEQFGHNLRSHRKRASLTQEELAHAASVHPSEVSRLEGAQRDPRLSTIVRLAAALGVPPASLLERIAEDNS
jgi:transcriptional regulator with XRE-family HTH domain